MAISKGSSTPVHGRVADSRVPDGTLAVGPVNPAALTVKQAARILTAVGGAPVTEAMIRRHIAAGAPTSADGRIHLVHYAAWLSQQMRKDKHSA